MSNSATGYLTGNSQTGRYILPDLVRAFALFGIVLVNVAYFAYPGDITYHDGGLNNLFDKSAYFLVNSLFLFKSYTLFAFMFGVGFAHQLTTAERRGVSFGATYLRRMLGLIVLGVLHVMLAFAGDILIFYGFLGLFIFLLRKNSQKALVRIGIVLVFLQILVTLVFSLVIYLAETQDPEGWLTLLAEMSAERETVRSVFKYGSFTDVAAQRWVEWILLVKTVGPLQAPGVVGFFLFGLAATRSGALADPKATLWSKSRRVYLPTGLLLSVAGSYVYTLSPHGGISSTVLLSYALLLLAAPLSSLGYIGLVAKWSEGPVTPFKAFVARGGTATLSAYLLQSLILSLLFCGYGLGLYQQLGAFGCIVIACATGLLTIAIVSLWRIRCKRGPAEHLLRKWTYLGNANS